jgi:POT family proton-dependent oligopeptide transporter
MLLATICFWMGRNKFVHIPPGGMRFIRESFSDEGLVAMGKLLGIYLFVAVFYSLYYQAGSEWVLQAKKMDLDWLGHTWKPSQVQAVNGLLILVFIPLFSYVIYPAIEKFFPLTALRKIGIGLFVMSGTFILPALVESWIAVGEKPNIIWQLFAYVLLTAAEVMVSVTILEFSYTQAPRTMKSIVMAMYLLSISAGNVITALVNWAVPSLSGADFYWFFAKLMAAAAVVFIFVALAYRERTYIQPEAAADEPVGTDRLEEER